MATLPPTIHQLLEIPEFKRMMKTRPWLPPSLQWGNPWRLWVQMDDGRWLTKEYGDYAEVWKKAAYLVGLGTVEDVCIVNKRLLVGPSRELDKAIMSASFGRFPWCPRCRRPTYFGAYKPAHHALRLMPALTEDEPFRCYYCGIRKAMARTYA